VNAGGELFAYSPQSGERLYEVPGWEHSNDLGSATLIRTADLDGDGIEEVFYVDTFASTDYPDDPDVRGRVVQFSGRDGGILWERKAEADIGELYRYAALAGDHDRDGVEDLLVTRKPEVTGVSGGALLLFSGRDGSLLETFHVADERNSWGLGLVNLGDRDGDGFPEILVAAPAYNSSFVGGVAPYGDQAGWVGLYPCLSGRPPPGPPPRGGRRPEDRLHRAILGVRERLLPHRVQVDLREGKRAAIAAGEEALVGARDAPDLDLAGAERRGRPRNVAAGRRRRRPRARGGRAPAPGRRIVHA
jgi:hypothetical protein